MKQLSCIIIDDEKHSRETTEMLLQASTHDVQIIGEASNGPSGIERILDMNPDFIILDINMPGMSGIEMLNHIPDYEGEVIFLTAYDQYAIDAFKKGVIHYLLKPVDPEDLDEAIERVKTSLKKSKEKPKGQYLTLSTNEGWTVVRKSEIVRCESFKNYTTLTMEASHLTISKTLKDVEAKLPIHTFFRVHKSHLINVAYIEKVQKTDGGQVVLKNGDRIPISKTKKKEFFDWVRDNMDVV